MEALLTAPLPSTNAHGIWRKPGQCPFPRIHTGAGGGISAFIYSTIPSPESLNPNHCKSRQFFSKFIIKIQWWQKLDPTLRSLFIPLSVSMYVLLQKSKLMS